MKFDQQAFACYSPQAEANLKAALGLTDAEWLVDEVTTDTTVIFPETGQTWKGQSTAHLEFCYLLGVETEVLRYISGQSFHALHPMWGDDPYLTQPFISHVGAHLEQDEPFPAMAGFPLVQEAFTLSHTSAFLTNPKSPGYGRRYHYRIHQLSPGSFVKFIKRILPQ
jgi:hypothetical protein